MLGVWCAIYVEIWNILQGIPEYFPGRFCVGRKHVCICFVAEKILIYDNEVAPWS
jgi:hypothetical protein